MKSSNGARGDQWWCLQKYVVFDPEFRTWIPLNKADRTALCVEAAELRSFAQFSTNKRAKQDKKEIPWEVAGACTWTGVEDTDTMQGCTLLNRLEPGDRAPDTSERLPDLQWHTYHQSTQELPQKVLFDYYSASKLWVSPLINPSAPDTFLSNRLGVDVGVVWTQCECVQQRGEAYRCPVRSPESSLAPATVCPIAIENGLPETPTGSRSKTIAQSVKG